MPYFRDLTCRLEWIKTRSRLKEYGTKYGENHAQASVAIPEVSLASPFGVRLISHGYIAPGLAMFVYKDGVYQCNRIRTNLKLPGHNTATGKYEVNFSVKQKEVYKTGSLFEARPWSFEEDESGKLDLSCPASNQREDPLTIKFPK